EPQPKGCQPPPQPGRSTWLPDDPLSPLPKSGKKGLNFAMSPQTSEDHFRDFLNNPLNLDGEWLDGRCGQRECAPAGWMNLATFSVPRGFTCRRPSHRAGTVNLRTVLAHLALAFKPRDRDLHPR